MQIGFFDSGIGGITVLHDTLKVLPNEDYLYYADTLNVPYGQKTKNDIKKYVFNAIEFITQQKVKAIVIACNTATSAAIEEIRAKYSIPIIGMEPAVKPAVKTKKNIDKRILVTATALTLSEERLQDLITKLDNEHVVDLLPLPKLVQFAENFEFNEQIVLPYLQEQLSIYDLSKDETIVLGCTHFSYYKNIFRKLFSSDVNIIDGNNGTAKNLKKVLEEVNSLNEGNGNISFYCSGVKVENKAKLNDFYNLFKRLDAIKEIN
ncbi:glutamate racemase [Paenibacillus sp. CGMCC 1.18879]|uniref:glutamate racemase n=1 Tax=Paenibacillus sp. CGMCC 1.18879 TaxID=2834466 RepID=UPI001CA999E0|nr:glutamate racemase [Paenibacillus sp. CGMCC 1.18879]MBY9079793.1 glutamate racemase [Paenibacillus sp. CGMCC 1.18879]